MQTDQSEFRDIITDMVEVELFKQAIRQIIGNSMPKPNADSLRFALIKVSERKWRVIRETPAYTTPTFVFVSEPMKFSDAEALFNRLSTEVPNGQS